MVQRVGGARRKTRTKMKKPIRKKGKISISKYFAVYKEGEKVLLNAEPAVQKGIYSLREHGRLGVITGKRGACYLVDVKVGNTKTKQFIVHPVHLKKA
ncbi:50S ribosomal protein L21e [Candidatus Woesearchaeota archaeon]|nr:50S ribosomal protein L21e [Candidatus Woesearchaeota archaeon]